MIIGNFTIEADGRAFFKGALIGSISRFNVVQVGNIRSGNIGIIPINPADNFIELATDAARSGLSITFDIKNEFWPNSYIKNGVWFADIKSQISDITVVPLGITTAIPVRDTIDNDELMLGSY